MANSISVTMTTGRITREPELRETKTGKKVTNVSIAVNQWNGKEEEAEFQTWVLWENDAEWFCKNAKKGGYASMTGYSKTREWENNDGQTVKVVEFWANKSVLCGGSSAAKSGDDSREARPSGGKKEPAEMMNYLSKKAGSADLPF